MSEKTINKVPNVPNLRFSTFTEEWQQYPLEKIAYFYKGTGISKDQLSEDGNECILYGELYTKYKTETITEIKSRTNISTKGLFFGKTNDVIIPASGETPVDIATACCVTKDDILFGGDLNIIRLHSDNGSFISYQLNGKRKYDIARIAQGASIVHLHNDDLKKLIIYKPNSLIEQEIVVEVFTKLDKRIELQSKIISKYETLIKGLCDLLFSNTTTVISPLKSIATINKGQQINGLALAKTGEYYYLNGGISPSGYVQEYNTSENTISISEGGNSCGFVAYNTQKFWSGGHCYTLKIINTKCRSKFLYFYLKHREKDIMQLRVGSGLPNIQKRSLENFAVALPSVEKQYYIEHILECITAKKEIETDLLGQFQSQKKFLLSKMFI